MTVFGVYYRNNSGSDDASDATLGLQDENEDLTSEFSEDYTTDNSSSESENKEYAEIFSDNEDDFNDQPLYGAKFVKCTRLKPFCLRLP